MALVVLLRGVNVGGHRTFKPKAVEKHLAHLDLVNIGAAGTFVIRKPVAQARVRAELARKLPFDTEIVLCDGREVAGLLARHPLAKDKPRPDVVRFVSVLSKLPRSKPSMPIQLPSSGEWLMKLLSREGRYVFGAYRRQMKVVGYLGRIDRFFGVPVTTRNWNTFTAIAKVLEPRTAPSSPRPRAARSGASRPRRRT